MSYKRHTSHRPSSGGHGNTEMVDLTLTSPSPSPEPPSQPIRQQQLPPYLKREQRSTPNRTDGAPTPNRTNGVSSNGSRSQPANPALSPSIPTHYLRRIINTSPPSKVYELLLDLCKASPALSGAVVRGLAPHSAWAQETIKDYERRHNLPRPGPGRVEPRSEGSSRQFAHDYGYTQPETPHAKPALVKREEDAMSNGSDSLEELDALFERRTPSTSQHQNPAGPSSSASRSGGDARQIDGQPVLPVKIKAEPKRIVQTCMQCHQNIQGETPCFYHIGQKKIIKRGPVKIVTWTCCKSAESAKGCCEGVHIPLQDSTLDDAFKPTDSKRARLV